jgi:pimeloyl-ACP methyl ester carboxylesterase
VPRQELSRAGAGGRGLSYLDFGGDGRVMVALHGSFGRGAIFAQLAADLRGLARVVAPDQRGPRAGHWIHDDDPPGFARAITAFLADIA